MVTYLSQRLLDIKSRYTFIEKLCLLVYYACTKSRHYLLSSSCIVVCQHDIIKCMMHKPVLSGRMGKWEYALVEYDWRYEPLKAMKGQVIADFIVDNSIQVDDQDVCLAEGKCWQLFFDGSVCSRGQGISFIIVSPGGFEQEVSIWLGFDCTNNQAEYEALLSGLEMLVEMEAGSVAVFGDSKLVVQQLTGESQCLDGTLNEYHERCMEILDMLNRYSITHIPREANTRANALA
jgi:ribonuclease HI